MAEFKEDILAHVASGGQFSPAAASPESLPRLLWQLRQTRPSTAASGQARPVFLGKDKTEPAGGPWSRR